MPRNTFKTYIGKLWFYCTIHHWSFQIMNKGTNRISQRIIAWCDRWKNMQAIIKGNIEQRNTSCIFFLLVSSSFLISCPLPHNFYYFQHVLLLLFEFILLLLLQYLCCLGFYYIFMCFWHGDWGVYIYFQVWIFFSYCNGV